MLNKVLQNIKPPNQNAMDAAQRRLDSLVKPLGSLGKLENLAVKLAGISGGIPKGYSKKCTVIMAADNGVVEEGVSAAPQIVTTLQTLNFFKGITGVNVLSGVVGSDIEVIDIGINSDVSHPRLHNKKIRKGTGNIAHGPAMSREEAIAAIEVGIETIGKLVDKEYTLFGVGEMGIGNTCTSSAVLMALSGCSTDNAVGKGVGLSDEMYENKKKIILRALEVNSPSPSDPIDVLCKVGGLDIAGMAGCFLGAAYHQVPIVIDGFISAAAAAISYKLNPLSVHYMIPSHISAEPGFEIYMDMLGLTPPLNMDMRLGEGSGATLMYPIIDAAVAAINNMGTFGEADIGTDFLEKTR